MADGNGDPLALSGIVATVSGDGQSDDAAVLTPELFKEALGVSGPPVGSMQMFAGAVAPSGWLLCNGAAVSRATHAALFAAIGTTYGAGNGASTFNLPDMRGYMPIGVGGPHPEDGTNLSLGEYRSIGDPNTFTAWSCADPAMIGLTGENAAARALNFIIKT